jgi:hypothetical protein
MAISNAPYVAMPALRGFANTFPRISVHNCEQTMTEVSVRYPVMRIHR